MPRQRLAFGDDGRRLFVPLKRRLGLMDGHGLVAGAEVAHACQIIAGRCASGASKRLGVCHQRGVPKKLVIEEVLHDRLRAAADAATSRKDTIVRCAHLRTYLRTYLAKNRSETAKV